MPNVSKKIKEIRTRENLSQEEFSKLLGYSKGYLADIETGRTRPSRKFLESIQINFGASIDWLLRENQILDLIEFNRTNEESYIIFVYAFTQRGLDEAEVMLRDLLTGKRHLMIDASGVNSIYQLLRKIFNKDGNTDQLWKRLEGMILNDDIVLILKNMSLSKISKSGHLVRDIFKITDDAWERKWNGAEMAHVEKKPKSSIIILDFPSYLEKNLTSFWYYAVPIYSTAPKGRRKVKQN